MRHLATILASVLLIGSASFSGAAITRIKDLAGVAGARENQLFGYGIVVGLNGQGDKDPAYTLQAMANMLRNVDVNLPASTLTSKNVAAVWVTADISPFAKEGSRLDVVVSSIGDAKSLQGGVLVQTALQGADGGIYAVAQGPLSIGGFTEGNAGASVSKNHPTVGQIVNGAIVEQEIPMDIVLDNQIELNLRRGDFTSAARMAEAINAVYAGIAIADNANVVTVDVPPQYFGRPVDFIRELEKIEVVPDIPAKVIINERTGTIVATSTVQISACAVSHGNITVSIATTPTVSQPSPFATGGTTEIVNQTNTQVDEQIASMVPFPDLPTVEKVASHLNSLGVTPRDMMAIFQALKQAGALHAELEIQ